MDTVKFIIELLYALKNRIILIIFSFVLICLINLFPIDILGNLISFKQISINIIINLMSLFIFIDSYFIARAKTNYLFDIANAIQEVDSLISVVVTNRPPELNPKEFYTKNVEDIQIKDDIKSLSALIKLVEKESAEVDEEFILYTSHYKAVMDLIPNVLKVVEKLPLELNNLNIYDILKRIENRYNKLDYYLHTNKHTKSKIQKEFWRWYAAVLKDFNKIYKKLMWYKYS